MANDSHDTDYSRHLVEPTDGAEGVLKSSDGSTVMTGFGEPVHTGTGHSSGISETDPTEGLIEHSFENELVRDGVESSPEGLDEVHRLAHEVAQALTDHSLQERVQAAAGAMPDLTAASSLLAAVQGLKQELSTFEPNDKASAEALMGEIDTLKQMTDTAVPGTSPEYGQAVAQLHDYLEKIPSAHAALAVNDALADVRSADNPRELKQAALALETAATALGPAYGNNGSELQNELLSLANDLKRGIGSPEAAQDLHTRLDQAQGHADQLTNAVAGETARVLAGGDEPSRTIVDAEPAMDARAALDRVMHAENPTQLREAGLELQTALTAMSSYGEPGKAISRELYGIAEAAQMGVQPGSAEDMAAVAKFYETASGHLDSFVAALPAESHLLLAVERALDAVEKADNPRELKMAGQQLETAATALSSTLGDKSQEFQASISGVTDAIKAGVNSPEAAGELQEKLWTVRTAAQELPSSEAPPPFESAAADSLKGQSLETAAAPLGEHAQARFDQWEHAVLGAGSKELSGADLVVMMEAVREMDHATAPLGDVGGHSSQTHGMPASDNLRELLGDSARNLSGDQLEACFGAGFAEKVQELGITKDDVQNALSELQSHAVATGQVPEMVDSAVALESLVAREHVLDAEHEQSLQAHQQQTEPQNESRMEAESTAHEQEHAEEMSMSM